MNGKDRLVKNNSRHTDFHGIGIAYMDVIRCLPTAPTPDVTSSHWVLSLSKITKDCNLNVTTGIQLFAASKNTSHTGGST